MNIFKRIFTKIKQKSISILTSPMRLNGMEDFYDALNLQTFKDSLYLFIGVSMIRETVSSIELEMYKIKNNDGDVEEIYDDPFLTLIERPNYKQTYKEFMKLAVSYYLLAGETFWYLERESENAMPTAWANMRPDYVEIVLSADKSEILAYEFRRSDSTTVKLRPQDVLHVKNIDPTNPLRGVGVIRPATSRIVTEKEASKYQSYTFKNQGRPDIAVFTDVDLTEEGAEEARERWNKIYGQPDRSGAGFFGNSVKDIKLLNVNPKEMEFMATQNFLRDDILASLRIPKAMITSDDVNLANSKTARINYLKEACEPVLDAMLDIINNKFLVDEEQDKFVTYESEVAEDRELLLKEATELKDKGIVTINEARELMNYPAMSDGDILQPSAGAQFQLAMKMKRVHKKAKHILRKRVVLQRRFKAITAVANMIEQEKKLKGVQRYQNPVFYTQEMKNAYVKAFNKTVDRKAELFKDTVDVYNNGLLQRIQKRAEDFGGYNPAMVFDATTEIVEAKNTFIPLMKSMFAKTGQETMDAIATGFSQKASEQFYTIEEVIRDLEARGEFFILSMLDTDFKQLRDIIASGLSDGKGVEEIGRDIRKYFDDMSVARARTIARTETGRLVSQATDEAYRQSSLVTGKEWLTARDGKVRDIEGTVNDHVHNEGVVVNPGSAFPNGEHYPGELTINCRCALAPAV